MHARFAWVLTTILALLAPGIALAQGEPAEQDASESARERFAAGRGSYQRGDYENAIAEWTAAYEIDPRPLILYNLSQAYERNGQLPEAANALERYLAEAAPDDEHVDVARARLHAISGRLQQTGIRITGAPRGSELVVDGRSLGGLPRAEVVRVEPGDHEVVVRKDGYRPFRARVGVPAGRSVEVEVELETDASGGASDAGPGLGPYVLMGVGGALVVAGVISGAIALSQADDAAYSDDSDAEGARSVALASDVLLGVGAAAVAGGLAWWLITAMGGSEEFETTGASVRVSPRIGPRELGAAAAIWF